MKGSFKAGILTLVLVLSLFLTACRGEKKVWDADTFHSVSRALTYESSMELMYATQFRVDYYEDGFVLISISDGSRFLLNKEGRKLPDDLEPDVIVLEGTADHIYLVASAVMDMFRAIDAMDTIILSGIKDSNWYIPEAKKAMEEGKILYAGKYNAPDYERILSSGSRLAVESTMIMHSPDVKEKLESFDIPVLVDYSSYETHPLGRMEWVKLYGALTGREEEAQEAFDEQDGYYKDLGKVEELGKSVVFFYITSNETVVVRKTNDYISKMIQLAGGTYLFQDLGDDEGASSSVNMQMEEFYAKAKEADFLVYNSTVDGEIISAESLLQKSSLLKDFKAVKEGNVWCTTQNVYQKSMNAGKMIEEFHAMMTTGEIADEETVYLYPLQ